MTAELELDDIQGFVARAYGDLRAARYALLRIRDGAAACAWLESIIGRITPASQRPTDSALHIAFTPSGLLALGLDQQALASFSNEFVDGMTTPHRRRILGDTAESAPEQWAWGGPDTTGIDLLLLAFATDSAQLARLYEPLAASWDAGGLALVTALDTSDLGDREHFGFHDGVSQPTIDGLARVDRPANTVKAGEFILGYPNEYGQYTDRPTVPGTADPAGRLPRDASDASLADLGRNGSYLVFRQLRQDVRGFWQFLDAATRDGDNSAGGAELYRLAARMVGRWPSGAPLVLAPEDDNPELSNANDFAYADADPFGYRCPIGAHVRRAHPRDSLDPQPGSTQSIALDKRHRILRRGREYGPPLSVEAALSAAATAATDEERGLHFICIGANIARQFEFVQYTWINNPKFDGLYDDADPLLGARQPYGGTFTLPGRPVRTRVAGLPRFVHVRGGAYFFLPGLRALRYLARLGR